MSENFLRVELEMIGEVADISLAANFYTSNNMAKQLKELLVRLFSDGIKYFTVNMQDVNSIDSEGLGVLTYGFKQSSSTGGNLVMYNLVNKDVADVLEIVNLDKIIPVCATRDEALEQVKNS